MIVSKLVPKKAYNSGEVAYLLRMFLGPLREWGEFLSDCRQLKTTYKGHTILPALRIRDSRNYRPVYLGTDIQIFIKAVLSDCPEARTNVKPKSIMVEINLLDGLSWQHRKI
jgi:hypothetical protein